MTELIRFLDDDRKGRWANIRMDNGDPCWISIAQTGIFVKKSKIGLFGAKLYEEKNIYKAAKTAQALSKQYPDDLTPDGMWNPVLKSIVNAILHCSNLAEVTIVLNEAAQKPENQGEDIQAPDSFKNSLLIIANRLRKANRLPNSKDIEDAAVMTLTHILSSILRKSGHFPVEGHIEESDAVIGAIFLCFVGSQLTLYLKDEGVELPINDVIARTGLAVFQFLDSERAARLVHKGMEQYKAIIKAGTSMENIRDYTDTLSKGVLTYVMSKDERLLDAFSGLYMTLFNAQEK
jgi:hypothetical protein